MSTDARPRTRSRGAQFALADVPDPVFSQGMVGYGAAVDPPREVVEAVAPVSGKLLKLLPHAYVVMTPDNVGVLVHLGLDTVALKRRGLHHPRQPRATTSPRARSSSPTTSRPSRRRGSIPIVPVVVMDEREAGNVIAGRRRRRRCRYRFRRRPFHRATSRWKSSSCRTPTEIGGVAADAIAALLNRKPDAVLGLATGSSPLAIYDELAARCDGGRISFAQARGFTLDEYVGLPADHPERYRTVIDDGVRVPRRLRRRGGAGPRRPGRRHPGRLRGVRGRDPRPRAVSICRSSASAPTGTSASTSRDRRWRPAPGSRR